MVELTEQPAAELLGVEVVTLKNIKVNYTKLLFLLILYMDIKLCLSSWQ
jgi:hypothetical protein